jgi:hypothetical protein
MDKILEHSEILLDGLEMLKEECMSDLRRAQDQSEMAMYMSLIAEIDETKLLIREAVSAHG